MGNAKSTKPNKTEDATKGKDQPIPKPTKPELSHEQIPQVKTGKFDKTFPQTHKAFDHKCRKTGTTSDAETEVWDDIVEGYVKNAKASSKRKHTETTPKKVTPYEPELVPLISPKRNANKLQPPLPPSVPKPPLPADPPGSPPPKSPKQLLPPSIPSLPKPTVTSPLKSDAANPGVTNLISDEDHGDLCGLLNQRHHRKDPEFQSSRKTKRLVKVVNENDAMTNDDSSRQNGYDQPRTARIR